ncbi:MAG: D-aminoacyl-tRNA deacylase [Candidatus Korarchaeum sp.]|nr:D-aminoacyl-tRNA deacylase [Candidatus Korarchaeum sp.]
MVRKLALAYSKRDPAGSGIVKKIREAAGEEFSLSDKKCEILELDREILYLKDDFFRGFDYILVLSKHSGTPDHPIFTAHAPGNFGRAKYGGDHFKLSIAIPSLMKEYLMAASKRAEGIGYWVGFEPTHHGPTLDLPTAFLEVGCDERAWSDENGLRVAYESTLEAIESWRDGKFVAAVAFGGPHVNEHFTKVELFTKFAIGHAARKLDAEWVDEEMVRQALVRSSEPVSHAIVDNKGLRGEDRDRIEGVLKNLGISVLRVRRVLRDEIGAEEGEEEI